MDFTAMIALTLTVRWVVLNVTEFILTNVGIINPYLTLLHTAERLANLGIARADCFDFSPLKHDTSPQNSRPQSSCGGLYCCGSRFDDPSTFFWRYVGSFPYLGTQRMRY